MGASSGVAWRAVPTALKAQRSPADTYSMRLDPNHDLTDEPNGAPASELRPIFKFDGATHGAMMEQEARCLGLTDEFAERFLKVRNMPVPFTSSMCTADGETAAVPGRSKLCYKGFACSECGLSLAEKADALGWVFEGSDLIGGQLGSALMCTGCVHAVCKFCPHMWVAVREKPPRFVLRQVTSKDQYAEARSNLNVTEEAATFTFEEFMAYRTLLLRATRARADQSSQASSPG